MLRKVRYINKKDLVIFERYKRQYRKNFCCFNGYACKFFDEETRSQMCTKECINCKFGTTNIYIVSVHI